MISADHRYPVAGRKHCNHRGICMNMTRMLTQLVMLMGLVLLISAPAMAEPELSEQAKAELVEKARNSLESLYASTPQAKDLRSRSEAVLVFPDILKAGLLVGGSGGNGVLFSPDGKVLGYYNASSLSFGLQAGAENYAEALFLTTRDALKYLDSSDGWSIGSGPSITVIDQGAGGDFSTTTLRSDVFAFIYGQKGLMGGIGLQGQKITRLKP